MGQLVDFCHVVRCMRLQDRLNFSMYMWWTSTLKIHITKHLLHVKEQAKGSVQFCINFQEDFDYGMIISTLNEFNIDESRLYEGCRNAPGNFDIYDMVKSYSTVNSFLGYFKRFITLWSWL